MGGIQKPRHFFPGLALHPHGEQKGAHCHVIVRILQQQLPGVAGFLAGHRPRAFLAAANAFQIGDQGFMHGGIVREEMSETGTWAARIPSLMVMSLADLAYRLAGCLRPSRGTMAV